MKFVFAFLLALIALPAFAAVPNWEINKQSSSIQFEGTQMGATFKGIFREYNGTISFDAADLANSKVDVTISLASVDAHSPDRNKYLVMPDWFNTDKFPQAHFVTKSIEKAGEADHYIAKGDLTLRGVTLPVTLPFTLTTHDNDADMQGETKINRLDFNVGGGEWKDPGTVGTEVKIFIKIHAVKK